ncbi:MULTISPECIES: MurR/RpiR family transcriptional regulator [Bacillus]|uniref:MurR/RpiR family transcriptional regulator n=1 Tax=Bacillus TaxID=1386 RepID=UPI000F776D9A|nr:MULTISPECIES: MurR/RpiR family transcriptional regulator [Bacillus]MCM3368297.1 MurR/RpiR family transcriptional regulator [Bacillus safensis]MDJ0291182.1 MurR/RpiR family transcriptional regulator [Bacillus safensis]NMW03005.1 MurR/RpiR family transcriptional regulator [Bacillus safensis]QNH48253.1 MurR/RpiR family transcriptional regulator [Bacillus sp. PAMC28571]QNK46111.1 MurR/RpiR family transcriptional regulator [Bacillus sp. PAMC22265]
MILDKLVNKHFEDLNKNDLHIIKTIHDHLEEMKTMKIQDLARYAHTSISSIHRLAKKIGFDGYSDLKSYVKLNAFTEETTQDLMQLLDQDIRQTRKYMEQLDFHQLNQLIDRAPYIYIYGTGTAQLDLANDIQRQLWSLHKKSQVLRSKRDLTDGIIEFGEDDLLFIISLSGESKNLDEIIQLVKTRHIKFISMTTLRNNLLAQNAMFNIYVSSTPFHLYNKVDNSSFLPFYIVADIIVRKFSEWKVNQLNNKT